VKPFGLAQKKPPAGLQTGHQAVENLGYGRFIKINEDIAAKDRVEGGFEVPFLGQIQVLEPQLPPEGLADPKPVGVGDQVLLEEGGRHP
jgi:hypothetical protein